MQRLARAVPKHRRLCGLRHVPTRLLGLGKEPGVWPRAAWGSDPPPCTHGCGDLPQPAPAPCTAQRRAGTGGSTAQSPQPQGCCGQRGGSGLSFASPHLEALQAGEDALDPDHVLLGAGQLEAFPGVHLLLGGLGSDFVLHPVGLHPRQLVRYHLPCATQGGKLRHGGSRSQPPFAQGRAQTGPAVWVVPPLPTPIVLDPALVPRQVVPGFKGLLDLRVGQVDDPCGAPSTRHGSAPTPHIPP